MGRAPSCGSMKWPLLAKWHQMGTIAMSRLSNSVIYFLLLSLFLSLFRRKGMAESLCFIAE